MPTCPGIHTHTSGADTGTLRWDPHMADVAKSSKRNCHALRYGPMPQRRGKRAIGIHRGRAQSQSSESTCRAARCQEPGANLLGGVGARGTPDLRTSQNHGCMLSPHCGLIIIHFKIRYEVC